MLLNRLTEIFITTWLLLLLQGCGFQLKGSPVNEPAEFAVALQGAPEVQSMQYRLERALRANGAEVSDIANENVGLQVFIKELQPARRVLARDASGRASEYLFRLSVTLEYRWLANTPVLKTFSAQRTYHYSNEQLLATHRQERQYLAEMQEQLAHQITGYFSRLVHSSSLSEVPYAD